MGRLRLSLPEHLPFATDLPVRITDINYGGHMANQALLGMMHEARMQFLHHYGYTELSLEGVSLIMADSAIVYLGEAFYGDDLRFELGPGDFSRRGFDLFYRMSCPERAQNIAHAKTAMVCFDYERRQVQSLPEAFRQRFEG
jgi:acyl-CoA thioesterase FadM